MIEDGDNMDEIYNLSVLWINKSFSKFESFDNKKKGMEEFFLKQSIASSLPFQGNLTTPEHSIYGHLSSKRNESARWRKKGSGEGLELNAE